MKRRVVMKHLRSRTLTHVIVGIVCAAASRGVIADDTMDYGDNDAVRSIVAEMMADAETRSSMLQSGTAGHDGGFYMASSDNAFRLNIKGALQYRYQMNFRDGDGGTDDFESGFSSPRTLLFFKGHVFDPRLFFQIRANFGRTDGVARRDDAFVGYKIDENWTVRAGQGLFAFTREWYHGDLKLQTAERSLSAYMFGEQRAQFIDMKYQDDDSRFIFTFSDGFRSQNTDFNSDPADWALTARTELKLDGSWKAVTGDYTSPRGTDPAAAFGAAVHFEQGPNTPGVASQDLFAWTVDFLYKGGGWNVFAAAVGYHTQDEAGVNGADFAEYGIVAQGGAYVTDDTELFARYDLILPDDDRTDNDSFNAVTFGFNHFLHGQAARFTLQAQWFLDPTLDSEAGNFGNTGPRNPNSTLFGVLPSSERDQVTITAQFMLLF
jgi:hypothetical protein